MTSGTVIWDDVGEGYKIPALTKIPTYMQLFMFSAVTWNRHLIHYNAEFARRDGLKDVAVHRALMGSFLAQMLTDWLGEVGKISRLEWSVRGGATPGDVLTCRGEVVGSKPQRILQCDVRIERQDGEVIVLGKAEVQVTGR